MDWRIFAAITVVTWGAYNIVLKFAAKYVAWQVSMLLFVTSYAIVLGVFCLVQGGITRAAIISRASVWPLLAGVLCAIGAITYFRGLNEAPGSIFMPLIGLATFVSAVGCLIFFREPVTLRVVLGIFCALAAIVLLSK